MDTGAYAFFLFCRHQCHFQGGSGDIYDIKTENGSALMPAVKEFVKEIRLDEGILVTPIKGIFDED